MTPVADESLLCHEKFYGVEVNNHRELARFIGPVENGSAFLIVDSIVRLNSAIKNITVHTGKLPEVVWELKE